MCWVALDRLLHLQAAGHIRVPVEELVAERDAIRGEVAQRGYNERLGSYTGVFGGEEVDASLLLLGLHGFTDPRSSRMRGTCARIREQLGINGLLYRYPYASDGLSGGEGAFGICSFWVVQVRALQGAVDEAGAEFEHVLSFVNDLGLFAEEIDPATGEALGNFPQAFTHIGLINAALALAHGLRADASRTGTARVLATRERPLSRDGRRAAECVPASQRRSARERE